MMNPFVAGARGYIDDVIQPHETRKRLCRSLAMLRDKKLDSLVRNLFRPSYGGNRNFTLMYSLGNFLVTQQGTQDVRFGPL